MFLEKYVGKPVAMYLHDGASEQLQFFMQKSSGGNLYYVKPVAVDPTGIWIENPNWETIKTKTNEKMEHKLHFFVSWNFVKSIGVFPERKFEGKLGEEEKEVRTIGLKP